MATKSVIDIEIHDEAFKEFAALFQKYQSQLGKMPGQWGKVGSATQQSAKGFDAATKNLMQAATAMNNIYAAQAKVAAEQSKINKIAKDTQRTFENIGKTTANIGKSVASTTLNLLRWSGIGLAAGLLGGAGGLFGLTSFAANIGDLRRQSQGLGVSSAELRAARVGYGRYADVDPLLGSLSAAQTDVTKQWAFGANRLNPNQSAAELLPQLLRRAGEVYKQGPAATAQQRLQAQGLDVLGITVETARRMAQITEKEQKDAEEKYQRDLKSFDVIDETLKKWQEFSVTINEAGEKIKTTFINGLAPLAEPLGHLADSFSSVVASFLKNPDLPKWIDTFGKKIEEFAKYLGSDQFQKDIDKFFQKLASLADMLGDFVDFVGKFMPSKTATEENRAYYAPGGPAEQEAAAKPSWLDSMYIKELERKRGLPSGSLDYIWQKESNRKLISKPSPKGAKGPFQFMPETATQYGVENPEDFKQSAEGASKYLQYLLKHYNGDIEKAWAAYNWGESNLDKDIAAHGSDWKNYLPDETKKYIGVPTESGGSSPTGSSTTPQKTGMLNWNPTQIALNVTTTKIPGQDTTVNMLAAGGYYTGLGVS